MKNEIRNTLQGGLCIRESAQGAEGDNSKGGQFRTISGYAIRFNEESVVLDEWGEQFKEIILPSACTEEYVNQCDIKMTLFHNREKLLARSNKGVGSLHLSVDEQGVKFEFDADMNTELGRYAASGVERGDLSGCSFTFCPGDYEVDRSGDVVTIRHKSFSWLGEMTIGSDPAYPTTSVNVRELSGKPNTPSSTEEEERMKREAEKAELTRRNRLKLLTH